MVDAIKPNNPDIPVNQRYGIKTLNLVTSPSAPCSISDFITKTVPSQSYYTQSAHKKPTIPTSTPSMTKANQYLTSSHYLFLGLSAQTFV